jgi:hypothetical protein
LEELLCDATAGDPISGLKWTRKTLRDLSRELERRGQRASPETVRCLLRELGYVLRTNRKRSTKEQDPQRDRQMRYVARKRRESLKAGDPVISIDAKKRELVGNFRQAGRTWRREPLDVLEFDYPNAADGIAIPYGIYDVGCDARLCRGWRVASDSGICDRGDPLLVVARRAPRLSVTTTAAD